MTSCKQEDEPKYHNPTEFKVKRAGAPEPGAAALLRHGRPLYFQPLLLAAGLRIPAICKYSALVSLDPECPAEGQDAEPARHQPAMAAMAIKTYELAVALNKLKGLQLRRGIPDRLRRPASEAYFRAVCEIPSIEGSRIVSSNVVSYNLIPLIYAEKKAAWIWILGDAADRRRRVQERIRGSVGRQRRTLRTLQALRA